MDKEAILDKCMKIDGLMSRAELDTIFDWVVPLVKTGQILEIGPYKGRTTRMFAEILASDAMGEKFGSQIRDFQLITIDLFNEGHGEKRPEYQGHSFQILKKNLWGVNQYVKIIKGDTRSAEITKLMKDGWFDFVFLDGDHRFEVVSHEMESVEHSTKYILGHDGNNGHVQGAIRQFLEDKDYLTTSAGFENVPWMIEIP